MTDIHTKPPVLRTPDEWRAEYARRKQRSTKREARKKIIEKFLRKLGLR